MVASGLPSEPPCWPRIILFYHFSSDYLKIFFFVLSVTGRCGDLGYLLVAIFQCLEHCLVQRRDPSNCSTTTGQLKMLCFFLSFHTLFYTSTWPVSSCCRQRNMASLKPFSWTILFLILLSWVLSLLMGGFLCDVQK